MNLVQITNGGKQFQVYFTDDLREIEVVDGGYRDGRRLTLTPEDKASICDIIAQEVYLSLMDYDEFKDSKAARV